MERYAPTIKDLAPRDIVARSMVLEVREGRGAGPNKDYVYIDLRHLRAERARGEAARHHRVRPHLPRRRAGHRAGAGVSDRALRDGRHPDHHQAEVLRDNDTIVPGLYAAGECACVSVHGSNRLGTNSLLDINVFGRRAGIAAAEYAPRTRLRRTCRRHPRACVTNWVEGHRCSEPATSGSPTSAVTCSSRWTTTPRSSAPRRPSSRPMTTSTRLKERYARHHGAGQGQALQHATCWRRSSSASCSSWPRSLVVGALEPQGVARRARPRGLPEPRRRRTTCATHGVHAEGEATGGARRSATCSDIRLDYKPVVQTRYQPMERKY